MVLIRPEASDVNFIVSNDESECRIIVDIPSSVHAYSVNQHKDVGSWNVKLLHNCPGFGKPYILKIRNSEKVDCYIFTSRLHNAGLMHLSSKKNNLSTIQEQFKH